MAEYDIVIKGGMVFDGARNPRVRADVAVPRRRRGRHRPGTGVGRAPGSSTPPACTWRPASSTCTPTTTPRSSGTRTARCRAGTASRRWSSATAASGSRRSAPDERERGDAVDDPGRGHPVRRDAGRHAVGLGDASPSSSTRSSRTPKAVNVLPYVPVGPLLVWVLGRDAAKAGVLPTDDEHRELARLLHEAMDAGALRLVGPAAPTERAGRRAARLRRHADAHRRDARRDVPGAGRGARRAQPGLHPDDPRHRQPARTTGPTSRSWPPSRAARCCTTWCRPSRTVPTSTASSSSGWPAAASGASRSTARASPPTPASRSRSRTGTSTTTPRRGARRPRERSTSGCASSPTRPAARP